MALVNPDANVNYSAGQNATMVQNPRRRLPPEVTFGPTPTAGVKADPRVGPVVAKASPASTRTVFNDKGFDPWVAATQTVQPPPPSKSKQRRTF